LNTASTNMTQAQNTPPTDVRNHPYGMRRKHCA
jgi:hypothetical protein